MEPEPIDLTNACLDLVTMRSKEPFVVALLTGRPRAEWAPVPGLCRESGVAVDDEIAGAPNLFVTWLADPGADPAYCVVVFYDDDSKWTCGAHYNRGRLQAAAVGGGMHERGVK